MRSHRIRLAALWAAGVLLVPSPSSLGNESVPGHSGRRSGYHNHSSRHPNGYPAFLGVDAGGIINQSWAFEMARVYRSRPSRGSYSVVEKSGGRAVNVWWHGSPSAWGTGPYVLQRPNAIDWQGASDPYAAPWLPFGPPEFLVEPAPPAEPEAMPPGIPEAVPIPSPPR